MKMFLILFCSLLVFTASDIPAAEKAAQPAGQSAAATPQHNEPVSGTVFETMGSKGPGTNVITVAEAFSNSARLNQKKVVVRGKVVKVSSRIMKRNWVHIQDGTGSQAKGTHNLVCTSQDGAKVGDMVTVNGILIKDRDFGSGYRYNAIIENATFRK